MSIAEVTNYSVEKALEGKYGYEITEEEIPAARAAGLRIHSFYRNESDETQTHYTASEEFISNYHRNGGLWEYNS